MAEKTLSLPVRFSPRGVYAPTTTAFENDEEVSRGGTRAFVRFLLNQGVDGLVPLGADLDFLTGCSGAPIPRDSH